MNMNKFGINCLSCGDVSHSTRFCHWCFEELSIDEKLDIIDEYLHVKQNKNQEKKEEVNKVRNCAVCEARKARRQRVMDVLFSAMKAGFGAAFQLGVSVGAIYYLIQEGVIL